MIGEKMGQLTIRPIAITDFQEVFIWSKDEIFCSANGWELNRERDELYQWWLKCVHNQSSTFRRLGIELNGRLIGYADLACIEKPYAEFGIAIGDSSLWGKGIGISASKSVLALAHRNDGLSSFGAETHENNIRSRKMLEKLGFQEISRNGMEYYLGVEAALIQYRLEM